MKRYLEHYIASSFISPFLISGISFTFFLLIFQFIKVSRYLFEKNSLNYELWKLFCSVGISFLPMALPLSCLFGSLYAITRLNDDQELLVMRSLGKSLVSLYLPIMFLTSLVGSILFLLNEKIIPESKTSFKVALRELSTRGMLDDLKAGQFYIDVPHHTIYVGEKGPNNEWIDFFMHKKQEHLQAGRLGTVYDLVVMAKVGKLSREERVLYLKDGNMLKYNHLTGEIEKSIFETYELGIDIGDYTSAPTKSSMLRTSDLYSKITNDKSITGGRRTQYELEFWSRLNWFLLCNVFGFLGFVLGIGNLRSRNRGSMSSCLAVLISYYCVFFGGLALSRKEVIYPAVAVFLPTILMFLVALMYYRRREWN